MNFLTLRIDKNITEQHLYKDVGGIPYALAKYCGYKCDFAYFDNGKKIEDKNYERYVKLIKLEYSSSKILNIFRLVKFICRNAEKYDVLNLYHGEVNLIFLSYIAKIKNPNIKIYIKLDLGRNFYDKLINLDKSNKLKYKILSKLNKIVDLYTVETKAYVNELNKIKKFHGKVKYLPNGFFSDLVEVNKNIKKEKIILTVGRLGTVAKNTEMFVEAIEGIATEKLKDWKIYLVGSMTDEFTDWFNDILNEKPYLKEYFLLTGNISDKKELYTLYARSSVFVLPSRWEGFPLVLPEALYFRCYPIVTNSFDGVVDIIKSNFGKIIPNEDKSALSSAIEEILNNKIDYIKNGQIAYDFVSKKYDWKAIIQTLDKYFKEEI